MSFLSELKRRNVFRVAIGYLAGAWFLAQIADIVIPAYGLPESWVGILISVLGIGLVPVLAGAWIFELTPEGLQRDSGEVTSASEHRRFDRIVMVILALAVGVFALDRFVLAPSREAARVEAARQQGWVEGVRQQYEGKSIVVLPFANLSPDPEQDYFADGLTEELLNLLARMPELRVISRTTSFALKGQEIIIPEVAERLDVSHVLEGSVRKAGSRIRVTVQLIEARSDTHLWSNNYDRNLEDIFAIQDEISSAVVEQLQLELLGEAPSTTPINPEAYELYLKAHLIVEGDLAGSLDEAEALLDRALAIEPDFIPALWERARAVLWNPRDGESHAEMQARIHEVVDHMVSVAPQSGYTQSLLGFIAIKWNNDFAAGARHYEQAVADDPFNPEALLRVVSSLLSDLGRWQEAAAVARFELSRDPACTLCVGQLYKALRNGGRYRQAAKELEAVMTWQGPHDELLQYIGASWLAAGEPATALGYFDQLVALNELGGRQYRLMALHDLGRQAEFEQGMAAYLSDYPDDHAGLVSIFAWTRQNDRAFEELDALIEEEGPALARIVSTWGFDRIRSDPRLEALKKRYGVLDPEQIDVEFDPPFPPNIQTQIDHYLNIADGESSMPGLEPNVDEDHGAG